MPRRNDLSSVLVIGSGPIVIGQACEFDYSGTQACRVLKEEGLRVILVNSNPATIMTDPGIADATYVEPITPEVVASIIEKERPDALLPTLGGQTALNTSTRFVPARIVKSSRRLWSARAPRLHGRSSLIRWRNATRRRPSSAIRLSFVPPSPWVVWARGSPTRPRIWIA